jgi:hypothetical protein
MRAPPRCAAAVSAVAMAALLAGCGSTSSWMPFSGTNTPAASASSVAACPGTVILRPLANTAMFLGPGRQPMDVGFYGLLSEITAKCDAGPDAIRASLDTIVVAERGPSGKGDSVEFNYFIAVTGPDQSVLAKRTLPVRIAIPPEARRAAVTDHVEETIALAGRRPADLTIVIGFQQTAEVVQFYKNFRGR